MEITYSHRCLTLLGKSCSVFLGWRSLAKTCSRPPRGRIQRFLQKLQEVVFDTDLEHFSDQTFSRSLGWLSSLMKLTAIFPWASGSALLWAQSFLPQILFLILSMELSFLACRILLWILKDGGTITVMISTSSSNGFRWSLYSCPDGSYWLDVTIEINRTSSTSML